MKIIITLTAITAILFLLSLLTLLIALLKKRKRLLLVSLMFFLMFVATGAWTTFQIISKSYRTIEHSFRPRTGDQIYAALFGAPQTPCVRIIEHQDQVIPKIDYAIFLHFTTCPQELRRILSQHTYTSEKVVTNTINLKVPPVDSTDWFNPALLGDTIVVHEYDAGDNRRAQTLWTTTDSTEVYCKDVWD